MKNPNKCRYIMFILIVVGLILAGISGIIFGVQPIHPLFIVGPLIAFGSIVFGIITVRCPFCHRKLHLKGIIPDEFCPFCGKKLK
ncbi:MAG: hypothetical protein ACI4SE_00455 [Lachnospiraceae bacterium]